MRKYLLVVGANIVLALVQTSFLYNLLPLKYYPNLVFSFGYSFILLGFIDYGFVSLISGGLFLDFAGVSLTGLSSILFTFLSYLGTLVRRFFTNILWVQFLFFFLVNILYLYIINYPLMTFDYFVSAFVSCIFLGFFYWLLKRL